MRSGNTLPQHLPDPLKDSHRTRRTKTNRRKRYGEGLLPRLLSASGHELKEVIVLLWQGPAADLYDHAANERAHEIAAAIIGSSPAWVKLERSRDGWLHLHIITPRAAALLLPEGATVRPVYDPEGLIYYLSKPADARACMRRVKGNNGRTLRTLSPDPVALLEAYRDFCTARRQRTRIFPRTSWTVNLPKMHTGLKAV